MTAKGRRVWPGKPYPLGATYDGCGTNFALFDTERGLATEEERDPAGSPLAVPAVSLWLFRRETA